MRDRERKSILAVNLGLVANIALAAFKTTFGTLGHSPALLAEGIMSTSDVAYYVVISVYMRMAGKPADDEHPYGHSQLESIAAVVVGAFILTTGVAVFWDAINKVYDLVAGPTTAGGRAADLIALWVALGSVALKIVLMLITRQLGRETKNPTVVALAMDHRNDIFSASAVVIGIFLGRVGYLWVDPAAGALVGLVILFTGIKILRENAADLMDTVPGKALREQITSLLETVPGVERAEHIHAHRFGPYLVVNLTVAVDGTLSVAAGDEIASQAERVLHDNIEFLARTYIHYHPAHQHPPGLATRTAQRHAPRSLPARRLPNPE